MQNNGNKVEYQYVHMKIVKFYQLYCILIKKLKYHLRNTTAHSTDPNCVHSFPNIFVNKKY